MTPPHVSVVIPAYNGERFVGEAVGSVLGQTFADLECIVVDDGSTDSTAVVVEAVDDPRLRLVRQDNQGVSEARNRGIDEATGSLVAFLDADDVWLPTKLARQVSLFEDRPGLGLVVSGYSIADEALRPRLVVTPVRRHLDLRRLLMLEASGIGLSFTGVARRSLAAEVRFDPAYSTSADLEFALRMRERAEIDAVQESLALYRVHGDQMHLDLDAFEHDVLAIYRGWVWPGMRYQRHRRRAMGNLYTRLFFYELSRKQRDRARRALRLALRNRPDRLVMLPLWILATRARRRLALARETGAG